MVDEGVALVVAVVRANKASPHYFWIKELRVCEAVESRGL